MRCLLCQADHLQILHHQQWTAVAFYHCRECDLIFREPSSFLDWGEQKRRYDLHENSSSAPGYLNFLQQLLQPLLPELRDRQLLRGMDWGSGPGPVLLQALRERGFQMENYDPLYQPVKPAEIFDFILCTEVLEHFSQPLASLQEIFSLLKEQGVFAGMTQFHRGPEHFFNWWYARDPTHICFYSERTLTWLAQSQNLKVLRLQDPVFLFLRA